MNVIRWHRPLLWLAALMAAVIVVSLVGVVVSPREITGMNGWFKPIKFALSIGIYAVTLSWLIGQMRRFHRITWWAGVLTVVFLIVEMIIIVGAAAAGTTSHFNVSTPFNTTLWTVMAASISIAWMMTFVIGFALFFNRLGDPARSLAIRAGLLLGLVGIGVAFLMTSPSAEQELNNVQGIAGAHTVGLADGGPSLFFLGWSTVAGDLRVPHFIGMHALQALPILAFGMELIANRSRGASILSNPRVRYRLVWIATIAYAAVIVNLTLQALAEQSVVQPAGVYLVAGIAIAAVSVIAAGIVIATGRPKVAAPELVDA